MTTTGQRDRTRAWFAVGILTAALWAGGGCYTLLRHPSPEEGFAATQDTSCERCHSATSQGNLDGTSWVDYYAYSSSPWLNYYASPWWYDNEWYHDAHLVHSPGGSSGGGGQAARDGARGEQEDDAPAGRLAWGRRLMADEPSPHDRMDRTTGSSAPIIPAPTIPAASAPGTTVTVHRDTSDGNQAPAAEKKVEKKETKGRAIRR